MSSWGLLPALSGFSYSGVDLKMGFAPQVYPEDFRTLWTAGTAWGQYFQNAKDAKSLRAGLVVSSGELKLKEFSFLLPVGFQNKNVTTFKGSIANKTFKFQLLRDGDRVIARWEKPAVIKAGEEFILEVEF
jgi:hypothetical protein